MNKKNVVFFVILLIISTNKLTYFTTSKNTSNNLDFQANTCPGPFPLEEEFIEITTFPVDLDYLYCQDNLTMLNYFLNTIGNWSTIWPVTPWNGHFHSGHVEGADKWYLYSYRRLPLKSPHEGVFDNLRIQDGAIFTYNSQELVSNLALTIDLGNDYSTSFGHIDLLKSIYDEIQTTGTYSFEENELIGYNHHWSLFFSVDFHLFYKNHGLCPLQFFSSEIQSDLIDYYSLTYERAKISGLYPESKICNNHLIEINDTVWGVWEYQHGPYDDEFFNNPEIEDAFGGWTFFNRNFSNAETFYRDEKDPSQNLTADVIGVFADSFPKEISSYKKLDHNLIKLAEGDFSVGVFELITHYENDWGPQNTIVYAKFSLAKNDVGPKDDILTLEFFADLASAQAGFTNNNLTLTRFYHFTPGETSKTGLLGPIAQQVLVGVLGSLVIIVIVIITIIIVVKVRKRKKEKQ